MSTPHMTDKEISTRSLWLLDKAPIQGMTTSHLHKSLSKHGTVTIERVRAMLVSLWERNEVHRKRTTPASEIFWFHAGRPNAGTPCPYIKTVA